jgi:hypothetical protein
MAVTLFSSIQGWIQSLCRGAKQRLRQWTRPDNSSDFLAVGTALMIVQPGTLLRWHRGLFRRV